VALINREGNSSGNWTPGHRRWLEGRRGSMGCGSARGRGWVAGGGRGGAPPSASAGDFPRGWKHGTKRWTVLEISGYRWLAWRQRAAQSDEELSGSMVARCNEQRRAGCE
jgi:hypothetical protein